MAKRSLKRYGGKLIFCQRDEWGLVEVIETASTHSLHFGSPVEQSCLYFHAPFTLAHEYQETLLDCVLQYADQQPIQNLLLLGLGGGSLITQLHPCLPGTRFTAIELRPLVIEVAHTYFHLPQADNLHCIAKDACQFLAENRTPYQVIVVDLYNETGMPEALTDEHFQQLLLQNLSSPGLLLMNLWQTTPHLTQPILHFWQQQSRQRPELQMRTFPIASSQNLILQILLK
ncbi:spermidine synthase [Galenea microaerophila]